MSEKDEKAQIEDQLEGPRLRRSVARQLPLVAVLPHKKLYSYTARGFVYPRALDPTLHDRGVVVLLRENLAIINPPHMIWYYDAYCSVAQVTEDRKVRWPVGYINTAGFFQTQTYDELPLIILT